LFARAALCAHATRLRTARRQRLGQKALLPFGRTRQGAKALVVHVVHAELVAVAQQDALPGEHQHRGVGQQREAAGARKADTGQKVAVAHHEIHRQALRRGAEDGAAFGLEAGSTDRIVRTRCLGSRFAPRGFDRIVTDPDFKQVAQDEQRARLCALHVVAPHGKRGALGCLQVQVGDEVERVPACGGDEFFGG